MSDEKVVEGVGKGKLRLPTQDVETMGVSLKSRVKLEKYNADGVLYETIIEDFENNGDH